MPTSKVFVNPEEDLVYVCEKVAQAPTSQVVLVIPAGANIAVSQVSLKLLARMLPRAGKDVVLVVEDDLGWKFAQRAGLRALRSQDEITDETWEQAAVERNKQEGLAKPTQQAQPVDAEPEAAIEPEQVVEPAVEPEPEVEYILDDELSTELITRELPIVESAIAFAPAEDEVLPELDTVLDEDIAQVASSKHTPYQLEPKLIELDGFVMLAGGDVAQHSLGMAVRSKLNYLHEVEPAVAANEQKAFEREGEEFLQEQAREALEQQGQAGTHSPELIAQVGRGARHLWQRFRTKKPVAQVETTHQQPVVEAEYDADFPVEDMTSMEEHEAHHPSEPEDRDYLDEPVVATIPVAAPTAMPKRVVSNQAISSPYAAGYKSVNAGGGWRERAAVRRERGGGAAGVEAEVPTSSRRQRQSGTFVAAAGVFAGDLGTRLKYGFGRAGAMFKSMEGSQRRRTLIIGAVVFGLFIFLSFTIFPRAEVRVKLKPKTIPLSYELTAKSDSQLSETERLTDRSLGMRIVSKEDSRSESIDTTGQGEAGDKAKGTVIVVTSTGGATTLKAGTVISAIGKNGIEYVLGTDVVLTAQTAVVENVPIEAVNFGEQFNWTGAGKKDFTVKGANGSSVGIFTTGQIVGGSKRNTRVLAQADYDAAKADLVNLLKQSLKTDLEALLSNTEIKLEKEVKYSEPQITSSKKVGEEADSIDMSVTMQASVPVISQAELNLLVEQLAAGDPQVSGQYKVENIVDPVITETVAGQAQVTFKVNAQAAVSAAITSDQLKNRVLGASTTTAKAELSKLEDVSKVELSYSPGYIPEFLRVIPNDASKVNLKVEK